jgi:hypothetical protein
MAASSREGGVLEVVAAAVAGLAIWVVRLWWRRWWVAAPGSAHRKSKVTTFRNYRIRQQIEKKYP